MAEKYNLTESDIKVLKVFGETLKSVIKEFNQSSRVVQQMEANYAKVSAQLGVFTEFLNKAGRAKIEEIKSTEAISRGIEEYQKVLASQSRQLAKYNEKVIDSGVAGAVLDLEKVINSKQFTELIKRSLTAGIDATADYFENVLSSHGKKALTEIVKKTTKVNEKGDGDLQAIKAEVDKVRQENGLITEEKKAQVKYTQTTLYGEREINKLVKERKEEAQETLQVEKQITEEVQKQTSTTKRKRGRPKKVKVVVEETTAPSVTSPPATTTGSKVVPYRLGSLIPHPTLYKYPSTALVPTGILGSASRREERMWDLKLRQARDAMRVAGKGTMPMGSAIPPRLGIASAPIAGLLPQFSDDEFAARSQQAHLNNISRSDRPIGLGEVNAEEAITRDLKAQQRRIKARRKADQKIVNGMGSKKAIQLGTAESSFREQQQKEEDANNRRRFVTDLATAIIAAQKKNPIVDLLKWAVLIMGKHLPVLSAALITLAPLVGIFKGIRALSSIRTALMGGKLAKNAPLAARLVSSFKGSNSLKALFGFGANSWLSQLGKGIGKASWDARVAAGNVGFFRKNIAGIRGALPVLGQNLYNLPLVQRASGSLGGMGDAVGRMGQVAGRMGKHGVAKVLAGTVKHGGRALATGARGLAIGGAKLAFRGLASPIMLGIDALCGFLATQGGKWWQRLAGMLLKIVTLGFMSDKKVRQIVGMEEKGVALQQQANNDEERRHQERIGWWTKFWAWLKNILPWGKKDGVKDNASKDIDKSLKKDTDKLNKANQDIDRKLGSTYKKGTTEYAKRHGELYNQYIKANTPKGQNKTIAQKLGFGERDPELVKRANEWADKMMNEEAYKLKAQKTNNTGELNRINAVLNSTLPANLATESKHGVDAVAMKNMGLRGSIWSENSIPYIAAANAGNLKALDNYVSGKGHNLIYTSAMGGHKVGSGHYKGNKIDFQTRGSVLTPAEYEQLFKLGYFGGNTGALGYEHKNSKGQTVGATPSEYKKLYEQGQVFMGGKNGNHYDFSIANGTQAYLAAQAEKKAAETATATETSTQEKASSEIREGLAALVGAKDRSNKQERTRNIVLSSVDVTGSLGVWGITQLNNGVMRTGR